MCVCVCVYLSQAFNSVNVTGDSTLQINSVNVSVHEILNPQTQDIMSSLCRRSTCSKASSKASSEASSKLVVGTHICIHIYDFKRAKTKIIMRQSQSFLFH